MTTSTSTIESRLTAALEKSLQESTTQLTNILIEGVLANFEPFFEKIHAETGMSVERLQELFKETNGSLDLAPAKTVKGSGVRKTPVKKAASAAATPAGPAVNCDFVMTTRSSRPGEECGVRVTEAGVTRCKRHVKSKTEDDKKGAAKSKAPTKSTKATKTKTAVDAPAIKDAVDSVPPASAAAEPETEEQLSTNKWGHYMDADTKFVFADPETVCGKQNMEDGKVEPLDDAEKLVCSQSGWEYNAKAEPAKPPADE